MPSIQASALKALIGEILEAAGVPSDIAALVAASLVDSSLKGVDSHGVMRISKYINEIGSGWTSPSGRPEIIRETATTAIVSGNRGLGIFAMHEATELAVSKAKEAQVAVVGLTNTTHTGRLGWYCEAAAKHHALCMIMGGGHSGSAQSGRWVSPYGGAERALATNPLAIAMPGGRFGSVSVDFATSAVSEGRLQVYRTQGQKLPPGWILDKHGLPSTDPEDFYDGGMILPVAGHKGYGLAVVAELLGTAMLGASHTMNWAIMVADLAAFVSVEEYSAGADSALQRIKAVKPAPSFSTVMIPGEPERIAASQRSAAGVPVDAQTWFQITRTAEQVGVDANAHLPMCD